ncbi:YicC-like family, N-terminal region [Neisseria gonorrhoeae]|uniref:YicC-like family, N-terminal region n=1 Tax=Neisseria gonorrhoeae TaxID=485 RepID=A0A378VZY4_NEIGO|nr:YicC-like family, N-terminal region [Neisseria gonorrhoeae]
MSSGNIRIHSMTGFANAAAECGSKRINLDIRAVNHRFLDIQIRMPDDLRHLENGIREQISSHLARGKVECKIQIQDAENGNQSLELNRVLVGQLAEINKTSANIMIWQNWALLIFCAFRAYWQAKRKIRKHWRKPLSNWPTKH